MKNVPIRNFSGLYFPVFELNVQIDRVNKYPYLVRMKEITDQEKSPTFFTQSSPPLQRQLARKSCNVFRFFVVKDLWRCLCKILKNIVAFY